MAAQAKSKNAWEASQQAALLAFKSALAADQVLFDAKKIRTSFFAGRMFLMFLLVCQFTGKPAESWLLRIAAMPVYWQGSRQCLWLGCCDASLLATQLCLG